MTNDTPKEWKPEYKEEAELISDQTGGFNQRGFLVNTQQKEIQIGVRNYMFHVNKEKVVIGAGSNLVLDKGGDIEFTSIPAPTSCTATLIATSTGLVDIGDHTYRITYIDYLGGETYWGADSNTVTVDSTHRQVSLTNIPRSTSQTVIGRRIYRTRANMPDYRLLDTIYDNTTTTYTDNIPDSSMGSEVFYKDNTTIGRIIVDGTPAMFFGYVNTFAGVRAGISNTGGGYNTGFGVGALRYNTTGNYNTAVGLGSLGSNISGSGNIAIGDRSLNANIIGNRNTAVGSEALIAARYNDNTAIGYRALWSVTTENDSTAVGSYALWQATDQSSNTAVGSHALYSMTGKGSNTAIGSRALYNNNGSQNVAIGSYAGYFETGDRKLFIDSFSRASESDGRAKALIYGIFDGDPANQLVTMNSFVWIRYNCSAESFTDRTPFYKGDALKEINKIKDKDGKIDHSSLPKFVQNKITHEDGTIEEGRDLGKMISMMTVAIQQLSSRIEKLEDKIK